jgi:protoheme IX farnesyltransferase
MSTSAISISQPRTSAWTRARDFVELTKPRIAVLVLLVVAASGIAASWGLVDGWTLVHAVVGTCLVAASASAANQWLESDRDGRMHRTCDRPLPSRRISSRQALLFAAATLLAGVAWLVFLVGLAPALWAIATWLMYVLVYTPLKTRVAANTAVGAVAGAMPVLIGWTAAGGPIDVRAMALFLVLLLWQFPHFMAIAWLYRHDYARGGYKMLPVVDPSGRRAGVQSVLAAAALVPVAALPVLTAPNWLGAVYLIGVTALGLAQLVIAFWFLIATSDRSARWLLRMSLVYMPVLLVLLIAIPAAESRGQRSEIRGQKSATELAQTTADFRTPTSELRPGTGHGDKPRGSHSLTPDS